MPRKTGPCPCFLIQKFKSWVTENKDAFVQIQCIPSGLRILCPKLYSQMIKHKENLTMKEVKYLCSKKDIDSIAAALIVTNCFITDPDKKAILAQFHLALVPFVTPQLAFVSLPIH